jgi:hypothetical protein
MVNRASLRDESGRIARSGALSVTPCPAARDTEPRGRACPLVGSAVRRPAKSAVGRVQRPEWSSVGTADGDGRHVQAGTRCPAGFELRLSDTLWSAQRFNDIAHSSIRGRTCIANRGSADSVRSGKPLGRRSISQRGAGLEAACQSKNLCGSRLTECLTARARWYWLPPGIVRASGLVPVHGTTSGTNENARGFNLWDGCGRAGCWACR